MKRYIAAGSSAKAYSRNGIDYYETDPRNLISEEDMLDEAIGAILGVMDQSGLSLDESTEAWNDWCSDLGNQAKRLIQQGRAKSVYDD